MKLCGAFPLTVLALTSESAFTGGQADSVPEANDVSFLQQSLEVQSQEMKMSANGTFREEGGSMVSSPLEDSTTSILKLEAETSRQVEDRAVQIRRPRLGKKFYRQGSCHDWAVQIRLPYLYPIFSWYSSEYCRVIYVGTGALAAVLLGVLNIWAAFLSSGKAGPGGQSSDTEGVTRNVTPARFTEWDFYRCCLEVLIIMHHVLQEVKEAGILGPVDEFAEAIRMPAFSFIAGVFGRSMKYDSVSNMLCYTAVATIPICFFYGLVGEATHEPWFLWALLVWRLTITPMFHVARQLHDSIVFSGLLALGFSLVGRFAYEWLHRVYEAWPVEDWSSQQVYCGTFFAVGVVATPSQWIGLLRNRLFIAASAVFSLACIALFLIHPHQWEHAHIGGHGPGYTVWHEHGELPDIASMDATEYCYRLLVDVCLVLSVLSALTVFHDAMQTALPKLFSYVVGWGGRTLYVYVLHSGFLWIYIPPSVQTSQVGRGLWIVGWVLMLNAVLGSKATADATRWALQPYWAKNIVEKFVFKS